MMKTLLFATAVVTALAAAAPAVARGPHGYYSDYARSHAYSLRHRIPGGDYGYYYPRGDYRDYYVPYNPSGDYGFHGYVPENYATYCGQMPKAC
jgi:hypothetical protein